VDLCLGLAHTAIDSVFQTGLKSDFPFRLIVFGSIQFLRILIKSSLVQKDFLHAGYFLMCNSLIRKMYIITKFSYEYFVLTGMDLPFIWTNLVLLGSK